MFKYAGVVINSESIQLDKIFTYVIPSEYIGKLHIGHRVKVPFGKGNKIIDGFVMELYEDILEHHKLKEISKVIDEKPMISQKDLELINFMKDRYLCSYIDAIKLVIAPGILEGKKHKTLEKLYINTEVVFQGKLYKEPYINIYKIIEDNNGSFTRSDLVNLYHISLSSINTLIKHGYIIKQDSVVQRYNVKQYTSYHKKSLTEDQEKVISHIINSSKSLFLIKGITGSGKTEVYMNLADHAMNMDKSTIILVPEIALTPQMIERFKGRFGKDVAVFHSKLSDGERHDEWHRVKNNKVKLAIGARSAIFLPFDDLGFIIIDEEHESSYKSDSNPKYNAKEIAEYKSRLYNCKVILGSATPSIDTFYRSEKSEIELLRLNNRVDSAELPKLTIIDMRDELKNNNKSIFSAELYEAMKESLDKKEQIILFLNRRGFSTFVSCRKCGYVFKCDNCDISLTYHWSGNYLSCHYCGKTMKATNTCPSCKSNYVKHFGIGTEKVEAAIKRTFPEARVIRMDLDTTRKKNSYEDIYNSFKNQEADILVGTQMVAKGLDFHNVTLVGVLAADLSLNLPDYRSNEKTFQLITQVAGRAGRGRKKGRVIVQTYLPDNYSIKLAQKYDYDGFYREEIKIRKDMNYPPFSKILSITLSSKNEDLLIKNIQNLAINLRSLLLIDDKIEILGPTPCIISKINEFFRWQIIIKGQLTQSFNKNVKEMVYETLKEVYNDIRINIDINPNNLV